MLQPDKTRLDSWKEIATYLARDIRTVIRWEKERGLPVHRIPGGKKHAVYAYKSEIDAWLDGAGAGRLSDTASVGAAPVTAPVAGRRRIVWIVAVAALLIAGAAIAAWLSRPLPLPRVFAYTQLTHDGRQKVAPLLTEGARVYFTELTPEGPRLASVAVGGGDTEPVTTPSTYLRPVDLSVSRGDFLGIDNVPGKSEYPLLAWPVGGGSPRRLGDLTGSQAAWSPDGQQIAYTRGPDLYIAKADGSASRKVASAGVILQSPRWSPDGERLRFTVESPQKDSCWLWEVQVDGSNLHQLSLAQNRKVNDLLGAWIPDGRYFLYSSLENDRRNIWGVREKTGILRGREPRVFKLTEGPMDFSCPLPSLDGKKVFAIGTATRFELARYDAVVKSFVPYLGGIPATWVDFARDGRSLAYTKLPDKTLWRSRLDGSEPRQLTFAPMKVDGLAWAPDGKRIAIRARVPGKVYKIYLIATDGGGPQELLPDHAEEEGIPSWSPDGKKVAFGDVPVVYGHSTGKEVIHVYDVGMDQLSALPRSQGLWTSRWSPDGRYMAALTIAEQELVLFDFKSQKWRHLGIKSGYNPTWSQDGKDIYLDTFDEFRTLFRVRVSDGKPERLVDLGRMAREPWSGVAPDGSPLLTRDTVISEIHALDVDLP